MSIKQKTMFLCLQCGPFVRVYTEVWTRESDGPYKIEFIHHIEGNAELADEVLIKPKPEGEKIDYSYCGKCNQLISKDESMNWGDDLMQMELKANK